MVNSHIAMQKTVSSLPSSRSSPSGDIDTARLGSSFNGIPWLSDQPPPPPPPPPPPNPSLHRQQHSIPRTSRAILMTTSVPTSVLLLVLPSPRQCRWLNHAWHINVDFSMEVKGGILTIHLPWVLLWSRRVKCAPRREFRTNTTTHSTSSSTLPWSRPNEAANPIFIST